MILNITRAIIKLFSLFFFKCNNGRFPYLILYKNKRTIHRHDFGYKSTRSSK